MVCLVFEDGYFPAKTRTEIYPNSYEIFLQLVGLSPLCMSCHFSLSRNFFFSSQILPNFDGILNFSSVETREKPLPRHSTPSGFHSEVNTSLKYTSCVNLEHFYIVQLLSEAVVPFSLALRKFKINKALCHLFLVVFIILFCFFNISFRVILKKFQASFSNLLYKVLNLGLYF